MKLLIVDDQPSVVEGLEKGIDWKSLGFTTVLKAYNALDARSILLSHSITVMLCDIQMPVETGLELFAWMKSRNMDVSTIFLTSHAEFEFAQQALKLGSLDYIIQPAPYSEIYKAVEKAVFSVKESSKIDEMVTLGREFRRQKYVIHSRAVSDLLNNRMTPQKYIHLEKLHILPSQNSYVYPCLLSFQKLDNVPIWESGLMDAALTNMLTEILEPFASIPILGSLSTDEYSILIPQAEMTPDIVEHQLHFLASACAQYLDRSISIFFAAPTRPMEIFEAWEQIQRKYAQNVTHKSGVFYISKKATEMYVYRVPEIKQWASLLKAGYGQALEGEACNLLDELVVQQKMNAKTLNAFYLDFIEMVFTSHSNCSISIFNTPERMDIYRSGMRDVSSMKKLVHLVAEHCTFAVDDQNQKSRVERIIRYINEHLDSELKRDDLAEKMNLSPDYMTRIFKAEMGVTVKEYIIRQKMKMAQSLLRKTKLPISFVAVKVGYQNLSHFSYTYKKEFGITPQEERSNEAVTSFSKVP